MAGIFNSAIFNNAIFNTGDAAAPVVDDVVKTGTGGIDAPRRIVKPTGLLHIPKKKEGRKEVADRVDESQAIQAEIAARLAKEFSEENAALDVVQPPVREMSMLEVEREIGLLLRKKLRTEEDDVLLIMLMAAAAA